MYKNVYLVGMTVFLAIFAMVVTFSTCEAGGRVPVDRCAGNHAPLYDVYPMVGADEASAYYLDTSSCTYSIDGNKAYPSCLVYATSGGVGADGGPAKLTQHVITFETFKNRNGKRIIRLQSEIVRDKDIAVDARRYDDGFLWSLFWTVAGESGLRNSLD